MNRSVTSLLVILLIQCGITAAVYWPAQDPEGQATTPALASFSNDLVDELRVGDEYDNEALIKRVGESWLLPELEGLPANKAMVEKLLERLVNQDSGWPIAQSNVARQRFQVSEYHYQRSITLLREGQRLATIYLGTSPGFRKVHARNDAHNAIYSITFNAFDAPGVSGSWLEPGLLQIRSPLRITADSYTLSRENGDWISGTGRTPDKRELEALLTALRTLQVEGVAEQDLQRDLSDLEADLILQVLSLTGETTLELFTLGDTHFISSSDYALIFKLSAYDFDRLTGIDFLLISGEDARPE